MRLEANEPETKSAKSRSKAIGPFKQSAVCESAFDIAPDGKYRGLKLKRNDLATALHNLVETVRIAAFCPVAAAA